MKYSWPLREYFDDIIRIKNILLKEGYDCTYDECYVLWYCYSEKYLDAGWIELPNDEMIFKILDEKFLSNDDFDFKELENYMD